MRAGEGQDTSRRVEVTPGFWFPSADKGIHSQRRLTWQGTSTNTAQAYVLGRQNQTPKWLRMDQNGGPKSRSHRPVRTEHRNGGEKRRWLGQSVHRHLGKGLR